MLFHSSDLDAALRGQHFGNNYYTSFDVNQLSCVNQAEVDACQGDPNCIYGDMPSIPAINYEPEVVNPHAHICVRDPTGYFCLTTEESGGNSTSTAKRFYSDLYSFLARRKPNGGLDSVKDHLNDYVVFGETLSNQVGLYNQTFQLFEATGFTREMAQWNVDGFKQSTLYLNRPGALGSKTVLRPWNCIMAGTREANLRSPEPYQAVSRAGLGRQFEWATSEYKAPHDLGPYANPRIQNPPSDDWVSEYRLEVGNLYGGSDVYGVSQGMNTFNNNVALPDDGRLLYARVKTLISGQWFVSAEVPFLAPAGPVEPFSSGDFDANDRPDLIRQNDNDGRAMLWYMGGQDGSSVIGSAWVHATGEPPWRIAASSDFDGNGVPDLVWYNPSTGQAAIWYMGGPGGATIIDFAWLQPTGDPAWRIAAVGDFDANTKPDVVWQNDTTGQASVWYMGGSKGSTVISFAWLRPSGDPLWLICGLGDFNKDLKPDVMWRHKTTGQVAIWYMSGANGMTVSDFAWLHPTGDPGSRPTGTADFDRADKRDVLWLVESTRQVAIWYMTGTMGTTVRAFAWVDYPGSPGWSVLPAQ